MNNITLDMKVLFAIFFCVVLQVIGESHNEYRCIPMKRHDKINWPSFYDITAKQAKRLEAAFSNENRKLTTAAELRNAIETSQDGMLLTVYRRFDGRPASCDDTYVGYGLKSLLDYPKLEAYEVWCPSPVCADLNATTALSFDYYYKGQFKGRLPQGLDGNEYLQKNKDVFGEPETS